MKKKLLLTQLAILSELFPFICNKHRFNQMKRYILICAAVLLGFVSAQAQEVTISSKADWDAFAARVNAGETSLNAIMTADVLEGVTTMVGTEDNPYGGTFHGNGHTLTLALVSGNMFCAPFNFVSGATIENLKTTGTVTANDYHASGLVGSNEGGFTARNCWVDANISGSEYFGGLLGHGRSAPFTMENCLFTGRNESSWCAGGLVAWDDDSTPTISNCLNAGTFVYDGFAPIARVAGRGTITNCYYTTATTCSGDLNDDRGTFTDKTGNELAALLGNGWMVIENEVVPAAFRAIATMKYGDAVPSLENLLSGSLQDVLSISTSATPYSPVGGYPIIAKGSGDNIYYSYGVLKIEKAPLKVTAKSYTIQQGDPLPTFEATYSGFKNKQTVSVLKELPTISCTAANTAVPGVYDIEVSGGDAENYAFTYVKGKLTIEEGGCEAYANLSNGVLTFCFDAQKSSRTGKTYTLNTGDTAPAWLNDLSGVTKVVFDNAFAQVRPTSTYRWFDGADKLETIEGLGNLNTSEVTNMANMFQKCRLVESLDVSGWNTAKVTNMANMFATCTKLGSLDLSGFDTQEVANMTNMFSGCTALTSLNLSGWNTKKVTRMNGMFATCSALTALDVRHFDTQNVTNMSRMFYNCKKLPKVSINTWNTQKVTTMKELFAGCSKMTSVNMLGMNMRKVKDMSLMFSGCSSLESLDMIDCETFAATDMNHMFSGCSSLTRLVLNSFDTFSVTDMSYMFANCTSLETINSGEYWDTESVSNSEGMFENCEKLVGAQGTVYNDGYTDKDYARLDGGNAAPGYLSGAAEAYVVKNTEIITQSDEWGNTWEEERGIISFCFDEKKKGQTGTVYRLNDVGEFPEWVHDTQEFDTQLNGRVEYDQIIITSSFRYFRPVSTRSWFYGAKNILGLENLNTENVIDMHAMFYSCGMNNLNLSGFDTHNVTDMGKLFQCCSQITSLDISNFDTRNVTDMSNMFRECGVEAIELGNYNTCNVTNMNGMFEYCGNLKSINLSNFNTVKVTDMGYMFHGCSSLESLDLSNFDVRNVCDFRTLLDECTNLKYLDLSGFDTNPASFRFDYSGSISFGYCNNLTTLILNRVSISGFEGIPFQNISSLKVIKLNQAQLPANMSEKFKGLVNLVSIEMKDCDASNVKNMSSTFEGCTSLQNIDFSFSDFSGLTSMSSAFKGCTSLQSVVIPTSNNLTDLSSAFEGCTRLQTLDLTTFDWSNITNTSNMFSGCRRLQTIYSNQTVAAENSEGMFTDCLRLTGGEGTALDDDHLDASYACVDGGDSAPGYFTAKAVSYMMMNDAEMTFYYDGQNFSRQENGYRKYLVHDTPTWSNDANLSFVKNVTFDASFTDYQPTTTAGWFAGASTLKTITGLENLQTSSVESMKGMFEDCYSVTTLDLSGFSTDNVTDMTDLFKNCYSLSSLDMSEWTLTNVTPMESLRDCINLKTLTMQNAWMPTSMNGMFKNFSNLTTLDLSGCHMENVKSAYQLFYGCYNLTSLKLDNWDTGNMTNMTSMFINCTKLTNLDLSSMNTENVTNMDYMFYNCKALKNLDLRNFNTYKVKGTSYMFSGCTALRSIYVGDDWNMDGVSSSTKMFSGCTSLVGCKGTIYDAAYTDKTYARIDGGSSAPGYLAEKEPGIATDIKTVSREAAPEGVYSLDGQKLNKKPTKKGVYIINGRKVVVK